jgi:hypothetical protein
MSNSLPVPYRFRESHFRRFEAVIATAMKNPEGIAFNPVDYGLTQSRFAQGLRDAMTSLVTHKWASPLNTPAFVKWRQGTKVQEGSDGLVRVAPKTTTPSTPLIIPHVETTVTRSVRSSEPFSQATPAQLEVVAWLCHNGYISTEVFLSPSPAVTDEVLKQLETRYDIAIDSVQSEKGHLLRIL